MTDQPQTLAQPFRRVIIESPFAGEVERNRIYLQRCTRDCVMRGESPYASHRMLTEALDDLNPEERRLGIEAGFAWAGVADLVVFYVDYGYSRGMKAALEWHTENLHGQIVERRIGKNPEIWAEGTWQDQAATPAKADESAGRMDERPRSQTAISPTGGA